MRRTNAAPQRLAPRGSNRTRGSRIAASAKIVTAGLVVAGSMTAAVAALSAPASASTLNGIASISDPVSLNVVTSGGSTSPFTLTLPQQAACDADTATHGYHVYSYLVPSGTNLTGVTFESFPSSGFGLVDNIGTYYGPVNTAIGTGQIIGIPNGFEWGPLVSNDGVPLSTLLYTGTGSTASGVWEAGLVCANTSGAVADNWNTEVKFSASASDVDGFTWTAVPGPTGSAPAAFTSASSATFTNGTAGTFTPTASGNPAPVITESGTLPTGVSFSGGVLSGTPSVSGSFPITFTATNGIEAPTKQTFTLTVATPAPTVTGIAPSTGPAGGGTSVVISGTNLGSATAVSFGSTAATITADASTSITATSPPGSGTVDVSVTTAGGTSASSSADKFAYGSAPAITSATSATFVSGQAGTFTPTATGSPAPTITESGSLPAGVTFAGGVLSGTATGTGTFPITFTATNGIGTPAQQSFTLSVVGFEVSTTSLPDAVVGTPYSQQLTTIGAPSGAPIAWKKVALPKGFAVSSSGLLTGTPSVKGLGAQSVQVSVTGAKGGTPATATIPLTVDQAPAFGKKSPVSAGFTEGQANPVTVSATGFPAPTFTLGGTLPSGVTFNSATGVLSGTPAVTADSSQLALTITASNGIGAAATEAFTLSVYAPLVVTTAPLTIAQGATVSGAGFQLATITGAEVGGTVKLRATGLPKGLVLSATGALTGTVSTKDAAKAYTVTISASSKDGKTAVTASGTATITVTA